MKSITIFLHFLKKLFSVLNKDKRWPRLYSDKELDFILSFRLTPNPCKISQELVMNHNGLSKQINIESQSFTERIYLRLKTGDEWSLAFVPSKLNLNCKIPNDERI
jgi:hypothetical protein